MDGIVSIHLLLKTISVLSGFDAQFGQGEVPDDAPMVKIAAGDSLIYLPKLLKDAGLVKSASEARRLIQQGAVSLDGKRVMVEEMRLDAAQAVLKVGKMRFLRLVKS